jgi:translation initiation factor 2 alpha subunit (eIF-2alpha)
MMKLDADKAIQEYFRENIVKIEGWFNVISPAKMNIKELKKELKALSSKNWQGILK